MISLEGKSVVVGGEASELGRFVAERFRSAGAGVVVNGPPENDRIDALLVPLTGPDPGRGAFALAEVLKDTAERCGYPRHAIGLLDDRRHGVDGDVVFALAATLCRYLSAHTVTDDVRVNLVSAPLSRDRASWGKTADVALALASGLLDAVRGQVLEIPGGAS